MSGDAFQEMAVRTEKEEMLAGLMSDQKYLPCKFFYDETGSRLYEQITRLEEYYPSRTEKSILKRHAEELMRDTDAVSLVDIGSGDCSKISILLHVLPKSVLSEITYVPVDVSMSAMEESRYKLQLRFGAIDVCGIIADFTKEIHLVSQHDNRIFCFFGSTIGNLDTREARSLVAKLGKLMKPGERLLLGLDMVKDKRILERAYNDKDKVTSEFNKNILKVANRILGTNFDLRYFQHHAFYNDEEERVEMHLVAKKDFTVNSPFLARELNIRKGQTIHTENSHKFTPDHISEFASIGDLSVRNVYTDSNQWFTLVDYIK
jgi:L-histidine N-alpha-methyltransferase